MKTTKVWLVSSVIVICAVAVLVVFWSSGRCLRTGSFFSEAQRVEIAVRAVLSSYPPDVVKKVWVEHAGKRVLEVPANGGSPRAFSLHKPERPIKYSGVEDFHEKNSHCCSVVEMRSLEEGAPSRWSILLGGEASYVRVTYKVQYINEQGMNLEARYQEYVGITNCGQAVRSAGKII